MLKKLNEYLNENQYKMTLINNDQINIVNYQEIADFSSDKIKIKYQSGYSIIHGHNLVIKKMLDDEILITGVINNIETR